MISSIRGHEFSPVGGLKDKGVDGFQFTYGVQGADKIIYQFSIDQGPEAKIYRTENTLIKNSIRHNKLYYATNQIVKEKDRIIEEFYDKHNVLLRIYDRAWICSNINSNEGSVRSFLVFVDSYLHEFEKPGKSYEIMDIVSDPRLYVFLRQEWDLNKNQQDTAETLTDTLILYALEGTDPDKGIFKSKEDILQNIRAIAKFDVRLINSLVDKRLEFLSQKPRKINHHPSEGSYCLPFDTRLEIQKRNLSEAKLYDDFQKKAESQIRSYLKSEGAIVKDVLGLINKSFHTLFHQQGIEFANFVLNGDNPEAIEKSVPEIVSKVVSESSVVPKNREKVKTALLMTIRDIVYNGEDFQKDFLSRLSNTYMMLFMLKCDPAVSTFFHSMASKMTIFVDTSILVPALSEYYLPTENKRYWALLKSASKTGVQLIVNKVIVDELISSINKSIKTYEYNFAGREQTYDSEDSILYIDDIFCRAFFYAKARGQVYNFTSYIENFIDYNLNNAFDDIIYWLKEEFSIQYRTTESLAVNIDEDDLHNLTSDLELKKSKSIKAKNDAEIMLTIYALRNKFNETGESGILGYKTWWLSTDSTTYKSIKTCFPDKYKNSCYMRPDFLYNYILFTPNKKDVDSAYSKLFPTLLGANISFHLPQDIVEFVNVCIKDHSSKNPTRMKIIIRNLTDKLKTDPDFRNKHRVKLFLDEELAKMTAE